MSVTYLAGDSVTIEIDGAIAIIPVAGDLIKFSSDPLSSVARRQ